MIFVFYVDYICCCELHDRTQKKVASILSTKLKHCLTKWFESLALMGTYSIDMVFRVYTKFCPVSTGE